MQYPPPYPVPQLQCATALRRRPATSRQYQANRTSSTPNHSFTYLPREGYAIADHLAGVGADLPSPAEGIDIHPHTPLPATLLTNLKYTTYSKNKVLPQVSTRTSITRLLQPTTSHRLTPGRGFWPGRCCASTGSWSSEHAGKSRCACVCVRT